MEQMSLVDGIIASELREDGVLSKIDKLLDWKGIGRIAGKLHLRHNRGGSAGVPEVSMIKPVLLGQWNNLSDHGLADQLRDEFYGILWVQIRRDTGSQYTMQVQELVDSKWEIRRDIGGEINRQVDGQTKEGNHH